MRFAVLRMASASALEQLRRGADSADLLINELRQQVKTLKAARAAALFAEQEEWIRNDNLCAEIEKVKSDLILAEIKNGVRQVYAPAPKRVVLEQQPIAMDTTDKKPVLSNTGDDEAKIKKEINKPDKKEAKPKKESKKPATATAEPVNEKIDASRLDLRIGKIVNVEKHPDADTLYVEEVDLAEGQTRSVVSGLVKHVPIEDMQNRIAVFMCNLKPVKMRGVLSQAMIMCATSSGNVEVLDPPAGVVLGERVTIQEYPGTPDAQLNPKKKIWEQIKPDLKTDSNRVATYKGSPMHVEGKGVVSSKTMSNAQIS